MGFSRAIEWEERLVGFSRAIEGEERLVGFSRAIKWEETHDCVGSIYSEVSNYPGLS